MREKMKQEDWKILFIDDEEGIRKVMSITLSDAGIKFSPQATARAASGFAGSSPRRS